VQQIDEMSRTVEGLKLENEMLRKFLLRCEQAAKRVVEKESQQCHLPLSLNIELKYDIANLEQQSHHKDVDEYRKTTEKLADTLSAVLEETDLRIAELKKEAYEFKRDIVVGAENMRTGKTMAEKITRFMEEQLQRRDNVIGKLRLKNSTFKKQLQKAEVLLKQKEEVGDILHYIDFHQLQIENKNHQSQVDERNEELLRLKMATGKTVQSLNTLRQNLHTITAESSWHKKEKSVRALQLRRAYTDASVTCDIATERHAQKRHSQQASAGTDLPTTFDYLKQKAQMYHLQTALSNWMRKIEIMEMDTRQVRSKV